MVNVGKYTIHWRFCVYKFPSVCLRTTSSLKANSLRGPQQLAETQKERLVLHPLGCVCVCIYIYLYLYQKNMYIYNILCFFVSTWSISCNTFVLYWLMDFNRIHRMNHQLWPLNGSCILSCCRASGFDAWLGWRNLKVNVLRPENPWENQVTHRYKKGLPNRFVRMFYHVLHDPLPLESWAKMQYLFKQGGGWNHHLQ